MSNTARDVICWGGRMTIAESVWMAWKDWEFGQKKTPSRWLTMPAWWIIERFGDFFDEAD